MIVKFSKIEFVKMWKRLKEIEILAKGEPGPRGMDGKNGTNGTNGLPGANGADGATGATGATGAQGAQGIQGNAGLQGIQGMKGDKGDTGTAGTNGTNGTNGADGIGTLASVGALIDTAGLATPNDSDYIATALTAGGLLKKITWTNVKAFLKTYFDSLYQPISGAWTSWSPTYANLTVGNGTVIAKYVRIGKTINYKYKLTWGSTTTFTPGSNINISLPATMAGDYPAYSAIGQLSLWDNSANIMFLGVTTPLNTTTMIPYVNNVAGSFNTHSQVLNAQPFTWATGDILFIQGSYEEA